MNQEQKIKVTERALARADAAHERVAVHFASRDRGYVDATGLCLKWQSADMNLSPHQIALYNFLRSHGQIDLREVSNVAPL